jgi:hypothetical protein
MCAAAEATSNVHPSLTVVAAISQLATTPCCSLSTGWDTREDDGSRFRAVASTVLNETGHFKPDVIERQLAHCERNEIRGAYNRAEYLPERKRMMQYWADYLETQRGKVLPMRGSAA